MKLIFGASDKSEYQVSGVAFRAKQTRNTTNIDKRTIRAKDHSLMNDAIHCTTIFNQKLNFKLIDWFDSEKPGNLYSYSLWFDWFLVEKYGARS